MGILTIGNVDFNDLIIINALQQKIQTVLDDPNNYFILEHTNRYYFSTPTTTPPNEPGWYIILDGVIPLYVGKANNLNNRLNTENGSRDQFANPKRNSDIERNFIKKYREIQLVLTLRVCVIRQVVLFPNTKLTDLDIGNIEKHINIWRCVFRYK